MSDILSLIWDRADAAEPIFSGDEFNKNGKNESVLLRAKFIRQIENASSVICDACGNAHAEDVLFVENPPDSGLRAYIQCPENGRVRVSLHRLECWAVDFNTIVNSLSNALSLTGTPEELSHERLWFLGKGTIAGKTREVFFARGLAWADAQTMLGKTPRLQAARSHLVIVAGAVPPGNIWKGDVPCIVQADALSSMEQGHFTIDLNYLTTILADGKAKPHKATQSFPTPAGTIWSEVHVAVMAQTLRIEARGKVKEYTFQQAGFEEKRRKAYPDSFWTFLQIFGQRVGILKKSDASLYHKARTNLKQYISKLRKRLQALIPNIEGDPIVYNPKGRTYETVFKISTSEIPRLMAPQGITWHDVAIASIGRKAIRISFSSNETFSTKVYEDDQLPKTEPAERERDDMRTLDLSVIGLAPKGKLSKLGQALINVLEGKGIVQRDENDKQMLELGNFLCELIGINVSAFDFDPADNRWTAKFEASCEDS